jgi:heat shock protein HslJ
MTETGQIKWDKQGRNISLISDKEDEASHYWVVENALVQLDQQKQKITGDLADHYRLDKVQMQLNEQPWQLMEIANKAVSDNLTKRVNISFDAEGKVTGQAPCNRYFASWEQNGQQLSIQQVGATKMACPDLQQEQAFFAQLAKVDGFEIKQTILLLKQGDEVLLSFKAAFEPKTLKD